MALLFLISLFRWKQGIYCWSRKFFWWEFCERH